MEIIIRIALMFFFIQFLVVVTIMSVAMLVARPRDLEWVCEPGHEVFRRGFVFITHLPSRVLRSAVRLVHSIGLHSAH